MIRRAVLALGLAGAALCFVAASAPAVPPDAHGWWWVAGSPLGLTPPYVPEDGLYVASNPSGPEAVSALRFTVAGGGGAGTLRLELAGETRGEVVVGLCALDAAWEPAQGAPLTDAPPCDPDGPTVPGTLAEDGTSVSFPVGALVRGSTLNVGVVPGTDPTGQSPTFQLPLAPPGPDALTPAGASSGGGSGDFAPLPPDSTFAPVPGPSAEPAPFEPLPPSAPLSPSPPVTASPGPAAGSGQAVAPPDAAPGSSDDSGAWRLAGLLLLGASGVAYHRLSLTPERPPRSLVTFGTITGGEPG